MDRRIVDCGLWMCHRLMDSRLALKTGYLLGLWMATTLECPDLAPGPNPALPSLHYHQSTNGPYTFSLDDWPHCWTDVIFLPFQRINIACLLPVALRLYIPTGQIIFRLQARIYPSILSTVGAVVPLYTRPSKAYDRSSNLLYVFFFLLCILFLIPLLCPISARFHTI